MCLSRASFTVGISLLLLCCAPWACPAQVNRCVVLAYNAENLFDPRVDSVNKDTTFTPSGAYHWTTKRLQAKAVGLSKAVINAGHGLPVALIGLAEVENRRVLEVLRDRTPLRRLGYRIVHRDSPDPRGIDVALLYRPDLATLLRSAWIPVLTDSAAQLYSRDMLACAFAIGNDTLWVVQCHWPSKRGSGALSDSRRLAALHQLRHYLDSLRSLQPLAKILVMGDFNDESNSSLFTRIANKQLSTAIQQGLLYLLPRMAEDKEPSAGYKYHGRWEQIDHMFASPSLLSRKGLHISGGGFYLGSHPSLLEEDWAYGGVRPLRTYQGPQYYGGVSDHLPIGVVLAW